MNINRFNAQIALSDFKEALSKCEFCAFDEEMTGVDIPGEPRLFGASSDEVYRVRRNASEAFNAFQFGIALFIPSSEKEGSYDVLPYNFYLLNREGEIRLNLDAIHFLTANAMDYTLWLKSGMRYCTSAEETALRERFFPASAPEARLTDSRDKEAFRRVREEVTTWYTKANVTSVADDEESDKNEAAVMLSVSEPCSYMAAKAIKAFFDQQTEMPVSCRYDGKPYFGENIIFSFELLEYEKWQEVRRRSEMDKEAKLQSLLGFREYWKAIVESKKPMVGHNCFQDILFMIHMHEQKLPESYQEFKNVTLNTFPCIYDTKTLSSKLTGDDKFAQTHLGYVYTETRRRFGCANSVDFRRTFRLPPGFYDYDDAVVFPTPAAKNGGGKAHEAGYDAFMTGVAFHFLRQLHKNGEDDYEQWKNVVSAFGSTYFCSLSQAMDTLVVPSTFIIRSSSPCHLEHVEAILFAGEDREKVTVDGKVDVRKLSYKANGLERTAEDLFTSFCVVFSTEETVQSLTERIQKAAPSEQAGNVHADVAKGLTVERPL